jgi:YHYH protein
MPAESKFTLDRPLNRRSFLALAGAGAAGAALIGVGAGPAGAAARHARSASGATKIAAKSFSTAHIPGVTSPRMTITVANGQRSIATTSMPDHAVDPSYRYAAPAVAQDFDFQVTTTPALAARPTALTTGFLLGVHESSVIFDPDTAEWYQNSFSSGWNENARELDIYGAHTHPESMTQAGIDKGVYHYHRITEQWASTPSAHSGIVGWASDGFPIYLRYGWAKPTNTEHGVKNLASSYRLKKGSRPSSSPGGTYDGTYVADYEYVAGHGDLDQCNGRLCVTPEFPDGIYAYFLTDQWPYVPHWIRGTPDRSFSPGQGGTTAGGPPPQ